MEEFNWRIEMIGGLMEQMANYTKGNINKAAVYILW
jgi:hypothetical protein